MGGEKEEADVEMRKEASVDSSYSAMEKMDVEMNKKAVVDASYSAKEIEADMNKEAVADASSPRKMRVDVEIKDTVMDVKSFTNEDVEMKDMSSSAKEVDVDMNKEACTDVNSSMKEEVDLELKIAASSSPSVSDSGDGSVQKSGPVHRRVTGPTKRSSKGGWTEDEDRALIKAVQFYNGKNWKKIAECFPGRSDVQCLHRWQKVLNPDLVKGPWTKEEDDRIIELVAKYGSTRWSLIAQSLPGRIGKQCRERWHNHLNPSIKKDAWTTEEEVILIQAQQLYGNKWADIARFLPGRADNSIKNHWNCSVKKKLDSYFASGLISQGPWMASADISNHFAKGEPKKADVKKEISNSPVSRDKKVDPICGAEKSSIGSVSGSASVNRGLMHPASQTVQIEYPKVNNSKPVMEKVSSFRSPREHRNDFNNSDCPNHTTFSRKPVDSASNGDNKLLHSPLHYKHAARNGPSPKTPLKRVTFPVSSPSCILGAQLPSEITNHDKQKNVTLDDPKKPSDDTSVRNNLAARDFGLRHEGKSSHFSMQAGRSSANGEAVHNNKEPGTSFQSQCINYSPVYYLPFQMITGWDVPSGMSNISKTGNHFEQTQSPVQEMMSLCHHSTPSSLVESFPLNVSSPESILRSAAKSFKNTPAILRKRGREASRLSPFDGSKKASINGKDLNGLHPSEGRIVDQLESVHLGPYENRGLEVQNNTDLNGKKVIVSAQSSSKLVNPVALKSVERQLENLFEAERDDAVTASSTVMTLDKSNDSQASKGSALSNCIQLDAGVVAAYD